MGLTFGACSHQHVRLPWLIGKCEQDVSSTGIRQQTPLVLWTVVAPHELNARDLEILHKAH
jgi:hypothetical protein